MSTWSGWQSQFLRAANIVVTPPNMRFLTSWSNNAATGCRNNPVDLAIQAPGASDCAKLTGIFPHAQHYSSHASAATAFDTELRMKFAAALRAALNSGNVYQSDNANDVASVLVSWGSPDFANVYLNTAQHQGGGGGGGTGTKAPHTHHGYADLRRTVEHRLPASLRRSHKLTESALRSLGRGRRVKR